PRTAMDHKIAVLKRMVALARSVPDEWGAHEKIGDTPAGWAIHAMVLDIDVGPLLQTHKLLTSVIFARAMRGWTSPGGRRERPPPAIFSRRGGNEQNPVASRHNTVAKLLAVTNAR